MLRGAVVGPAAGRPEGVYDLHAHPTLKTKLFFKKFWRRHYPPGFMFPPTLRTDFDALLAGNCQLMCCAVYVPERGWIKDAWPINLLRLSFPHVRHVFDAPPDQVAHEYLDCLEEQIAETKRRKGNVIDIAYSYAQMKEIIAAGKIAVVNTMEGAHHLGGKLENVEAFFKRGVASIIVPHMYPNEAATCSNAIPEDLFLRKLGCIKGTYDPGIGLTKWGHELVERMFDLGIVVDMTHGTPQCRRDVYALQRSYPKKRPVILSHVGVSEYCPADINPTPEDIRAIADTGGAIGIILMGTWLHKPRLKSGREVIVNTVKHLVQHGGEEVVALGSDFDGFTDPPPDFKSPRDFVPLHALLLEHFPEEQVNKFLQGNADRVLREGWGA